MESIPSQVGRALHVVVLCSERGVDRRRRMLQQMAALSGTFHLRLYVGPSASADEVTTFLGDGSACQHGESAVVVAHMLGFRRVLTEWVVGKDGALLLVLEDDVALAGDFMPRLEAAMDTWLRGPGPHGVLRVGYLPCDEQLDKILPHEDPWTLDEPHTDARTGCRDDVVRDVPSLKVMGMQASVFTRSGARELATTLRGATAEAVRATLCTLPSRFKSFAQPHGWPLASDHLLQLPALGARYVFPPLAIESDVGITTIGSRTAVWRWGYAAARGTLEEDDYAGAPSWGAAYAAAAARVEGVAAPQRAATNKAALQDVDASV